MFCCATTNRKQFFIMRTINHSRPRNPQPQYPSSTGYRDVHTLRILSTQPLSLELNSVCGIVVRDQQHDHTNNCTSPAGWLLHRQPVTLKPGTISRAITLAELSNATRTITRTLCHPPIPSPTKSWAQILLSEQQHDALTPQREYTSPTSSIWTWYNIFCALLIIWSFPWIMSIHTAQSSPSFINNHNKFSLEVNEMVLML